MDKINKKYVAIIGLILVALLLIIWPNAKDPKMPEEIGEEKLEGGKAQEETLTAEKEKEEKAEKIAGTYRGHVTIDSSELVGKTLLTKVPIALAKKQIEAELAKGLDVSLIITKNGAWTLDLGDTFEKYQITTIVSTEEDKINMEDGAFETKRGFYVEELADNIYVTIKGHVLDSVQGTLLIDGDTSSIKLSFLGSFKLEKKEKN
ncbi:MAG: hypothetical protein GX046_00295 [Tissierellia bacterium]|nr:hypothetical protein [Tissierellia bacterium]